MQNAWHDGGSSAAPLLRQGMNDVADDAAHVFVFCDKRVLDGTKHSYREKVQLCSAIADPREPAFVQTRVPSRRKARIE
jgi:hypothetical protein